MIPSKPVLKLTSKPVSEITSTSASKKFPKITTPKTKTESVACIKRTDFEVFGKVQRVYFRKHTQITAKSLNLRGWVQNTPRGTVSGSMEGRCEDVNTMMEWLQKVGSPKSEIIKVDFKNMRTLKQHSIPDADFQVKKN
ncbi:hypothetical protein WDU94_014334 [Cyamophila willieti]